MARWHPPQEQDLPFIDGEALVLDKPAGLPVAQPRRGGESLDDWLADLRFGFARLPQPVHRLDQDTSGCLLLSRNPKAHARFARVFEQRRVTKAYWGVLEGRPDGSSGTIDLPLGKTSSAEAGWRMCPQTDGKSAITHWRVLGERDGRTLVEFRPETGRTHQLRAHALYGLGLGLVGDPVYRDPERPVSPEEPLLLLHAARLVVERDGKPAISAAAPLPERFERAGFTQADIETSAV